MKQKVVVEVGVRDEKEKQKAMKAVSGLPMIDSISMDMKQKKLTVIGEVDPIDVIKKLRKTWHAVIVTVGPAKEPEKKKEGEGKKEAEGGGKKGEEKKKTEAEQLAELVKLYQNYNPYMTQRYAVYSAEENPNSCVIC